MTLANLLLVLEGNMNLMLTIILDGGSRLITFDAAGASAISDEIGAMEVDRIGIDTAEHFNIYLKPEPNNNEPEEPTDDNP